MGAWNVFCHSCFTAPFLLSTARLPTPGVAASSLAAHLATLMTENDYTLDHDLSDACAVPSNLGEPDRSPVGQAMAACMASALSTSIG